MSAPDGIGVGVVGLGFMGQTHLRSYRAAGARIVAVCDAQADASGALASAVGNIDTSTTGEEIDLSMVLATSDLDAFLAVPGLDAVSVCTPTDTHVEIASRALRAGKHVLVEKPVALTPEPIAELRAVAEMSSRLCMPAMCMRFWPAWSWVKDAIDDGRYGRVLGARFERLGAPPDWAPAFYEDEARSGGALFDLHVHDTDFVVHALGAPARVTSTGTTRHVSTIYHYAGGPAMVSAEGGWMSSPGFAFRMTYTIEFERAVADFELGRDPELRVHLADGTSIVPERSDATGWERQVRSFLEAIAQEHGTPPATLEQAELVTRVLIAERESLTSGHTATVASA